MTYQLKGDSILNEDAASGMSEDRKKLISVTYVGKLFPDIKVRINSWNDNYLYLIIMKFQISNSESSQLGRMII